MNSKTPRSFNFWGSFLNGPVFLCKINSLKMHQLPLPRHNILHEFYKLGICSNMSANGILVWIFLWIFKILTNRASNFLFWNLWGKWIWAWKLEVFGVGSRFRLLSPCVFILLNFLIFWWLHHWTWNGWMNLMWIDSGFMQFWTLIFSSTPQLNRLAVLLGIDLIVTQEMPFLVFSSVVANCPIWVSKDFICAPMLLIYAPTIDANCPICVSILSNLASSLLNLARLTNEGSKHIFQWWLFFASHCVWVKCIIIAQWILIVP